MPDRAVRPKKYLGQHFLKDRRTISKILQTADIKKDDIILEIGPGRGALTFRMAERATRVIAIEIDDAMIEALKKRAASYPNLSIIKADALKFPYDDVITTFKVVANLPYYISTPILFRLIEVRHKITCMTIMLQKEVANRIVASPDSKDYGILSIAAQFYTVPTISFLISRKAFHPVPEVDSAILNIKPRQKVAVEVIDEAFFWKIIKSAFQYRRKTMINSLSMAGYDKEAIKRALDTSGINLQARPEEISIKEWGRIADNLCSQLHR